MASLDEIGGAVQVKDVMTTPVVMASEGDTAERVAKLMDERNIGSIIVTDARRKTLGIITERDIVKRVAAKNLLPSKVKALDIMSSPLVTVGPKTDLREAARIMSRRAIRRLVVMEDEKLVGIITDHDIIAITPALVEIITERARISQPPPIPQTSPLAGYCDHCSQWSDSLTQVDGRFICDDCRIELETEGT